MVAARHVDIEVDLDEVKDVASLKSNGAKGRCY